MRAARRPPQEEHRHGRVGRACRDGAAGQGELLRDRSVRPVARGGAIPVGPALRRRREARRRDQDRRRARAGHGVPGGRRGPAVERGARVHPSADAAARGLRVAPAGRERRGDSARSWRGSSSGFGDAYPELARTGRSSPGADSEEDRFSATLRQGLVLFDEATRPAGRAARLRATWPSCCRTRSGSRSSSRGAGGRRRPRGRHRPFAELHARAARPGARGAQEGPSRPGRGCRCRPTEFVGYEQPEAEAPIVLVLLEASRTLEVGRGGAGRCVCSSSARRSTRRAAARSGTAGVIRTHTGSVRVTDTQKAGDHAIVHEGVVESGEVRAGPGRDRRDRRGAPRGDGARPHLDARDPRDAAAHPRRARPPGRLAGRARPAAVRLPHPSGVPIEMLEEAELEANRRLARDDVGADLRDLDGRGAGARRDRAVRREVRRHRPRRRGRRLLARAVRWHPRRPHRHGGGDPAPARGIDRRRHAPRSRRWSGPTRCARSTSSGRCCGSSSRRSARRTRAPPLERARRVVEENKRLRKRARQAAGGRSATQLIAELADGRASTSTASAARGRRGAGRGPRRSCASSR